MSTGDIELERLIRHVSSDLVTLPSERFEDGVLDALARIRNFVDADPLARGKRAAQESAAPLLVSLLERHREETRLRQAEAEYRMLVENSPDCIHQIDAEGRLTSMNPAGLRMMGASAECDIQGLVYLDVVCERDRPRIAELLHNAYQGKFSEFEFVATSGQQFHSNFVPMRDAQGQVHKLMGLTVDITERKELEQQLRQTQKMDAIGQLAGGIAHDFNNLLGAIVGYVELARLNERVVDSPDLRRCLDEIHTAGLRGRDLVDQLLTFSRRKPGGSEMIRAPDIVAETVGLMRPMIPSSIELQTDVSREVPMVMIAPVQLSQALMNLCINARDALGGRGRMTIALRRTGPGQAVCASCHQQFSGSMVELSVTDTGSGIHPEALARIFEPFYSARAEGRGNGMGLAIVDGIVHTHGGHLMVQTEPGNGSCFRLLLPAVAGSKHRTGESADSATGTNATLRGGELSGYVLIVDDESSIAALLSEVLKRAGLHTTVFADGRSALDFLLAGEVPIDLVITDQTMPGLSGTELARRLSESHPTLPVIVCTGGGGDAYDFGSQGRRTLLRKPVRMSRLLEQVGAMLNLDAAGE